MFTAGERDDDDRWSGTDLVLAVRGELGPVAHRWTRWLCGELGAVHHWDLPAGPRIIRVFLLPGWLEIDLTFAPEEEFGPRGPQWRTVFGRAWPNTGSAACATTPSRWPACGWASPPPTPKAPTGCPAAWPRHWRRHSSGHSAKLSSAVPWLPPSALWPANSSTAILRWQPALQPMLTELRGPGTASGASR